MLKKTICLNMIVKNEAHCIQDTLINLCEQIKFSYWVISDTGSTDNTKEVITQFFKERNIPGKIVDHQWVNFGYNRSKALESAYNLTDYLLIFDADDKLIGDFKLPEPMCLDKYLLTFGGDGVSYVRPLLVNNRKKWEFKGVLHEALNNIEPINGEATIEGKYHVISGRIGARSQNVNKYYDDAIVLKKGFEDEFTTDYGQACRYAFYIGQSYKDAGEKYMDDSIEWYKKVLTLHNWNQEKFYACFMIGDLYIRKNDSINAIKYWLKSVEYDEERMEGVVNAMNHLRLNDNTLLVTLLYKQFANYKKSTELQGKLFIVNPMYNDEIEYHQSICAYYSREYKLSGYNCCKKILTNQLIRRDYLRQTLDNTLCYKEEIEKDSDAELCSLFYSVNTILGIIATKCEQFKSTYFELWDLLFNKCKKKLVKYNGKFAKEKEREKEKKKEKEPHNPIKIFLSFTTCKRYDLFQQTINSLINHCTDIKQVDYWFCVDDNSADQDRQYMQKLYPWVNYYMKTPEEKGHRQSMNIIFNKLQELKPDYWIHLEDDFLFYDKMNYIGESIKLLDELKEIGVKQILFNRNYGETIESYNIVGHLSNSNKSHFAIHDYKQGQFPYQNCHYWPHYSFRPSLIKVDAILKLGNYDSCNQFFEMDYANKWTNANYKSAFFNKITNRHIGRLTSERGDNSKPNAYTLNEESQFIQEEPTTQMVYTKCSIKIINLKRRPDRKEETHKILTNAEMDMNDIEFIEAVDGQTLEPTAELAQLFKGNDFGNRRGFIGCALSHYNLWKQLVNDPNNEYYLIMEDDFSLCSNFKNKYETIKDSFKKEDVIFLGYHMYSTNREKKEIKQIYQQNDENNNITIVPLNNTLYIGGFFMYSINKKGAAKLLTYIEQHGIKHGIDYLIKICPELQCQEVQTQIAFSEWVEKTDQDVNSDIQRDHIGLDFSKITTIFHKTIYIGIDNQLIMGLGNIMFQIATACYYKEKYNYQILLNYNNKFINNGSAELFGRKVLKQSYLKSIFKNIKSTIDRPTHNTILLNDCNSVNKYEDLNLPDAFIVNGFCQNIELFFEIREKLIDIFDLTCSNDLLNKYTICDKNINIMMGIRIGPDGGFKYSKFNKASYKLVIDTIVENNLDKKINIFILSDVDTEWNIMIDEDITRYNIIYVKEDDVSQMSIGLLCNYFILSDSTFHWWIAFLKWSKDESTIVYVFNDTDITNRCLLNSTLKSNWNCVNLVPNDNFIFIKGVDSGDNDIYRINKSVPILMDIAEKDTNCIAFNSLGFFKNKLNKLSSSPYFKECDGIYIKKEYYEQCQNNRSLKEIAEYFILDKCEKYGHNYIPVYSKWLDSIRDNIKNIFEIGIGSIENGQMIQMLKYNYKTGNSLRAWKEY